MRVSTEIIQQLREKTGCGMMDCKKALLEAKGDLEKAADLLRQKGLASLLMRAERVAAQGVVASYIHPGDKIGVLLEVNCESDFVARGEDFKNFAKELALQIAAQDPLDVPHLMDQPYIRDLQKTIKDLWGELSAKIGENIVIRRFTRYQLGEKS